MATPRKTLYLDCDGVLFPSCEFTSEFIDVCVSFFDVVWISDGNIGYKDGVIDFLEDFNKFLSPRDVEKLHRVRENPSTAFWKHERLDLDLDFVWVDDAPMGRDRDVLRDLGLEDRLLIVKAWRPHTMRAGIESLRKLNQPPI